MNKWMIIAVIYATVKRISLLKSAGLNGIRNHDFCDVGAVLYQLLELSSNILRYKEMFK